MKLRKTEQNWRKLMKIEFVEIYVNFFDALSGVGEVHTIFFRADEEK